MYRKFLSLVLSVAIILYVCAGNMVDAYAAIKSDVQQEEKINQLDFEMEEQIADNASDYIKEKYSVILKSVRDNSKELDIRKELLDNAILGKPFMVYDMDAPVQYEEIYYPVVHRKTDEVIFVITVIGTTQGWQYKIGTDMVDELNKLDYDAEGKYVFYEEDEEIIGQSLSKKVWFDDEKVNNTVSEEDFMKTADKTLTNFQDTKKVDIEACVQAGKNIIDSSNVAVSELGYFYLGIYNSKGQGNYGLCWAASVATIVNYMKDKDNSKTSSK